MAAQANTIQLQHAAASLTRCVIHTHRSPQLIQLLFLNNPSFTTTSPTCGKQLQKILPACTVTTVSPSKALQLTVRSGMLGRWNHPLSAQLAAAEQHVTEVRHLLRKTFLAPPPPPPPPHVQRLFAACEGIRWSDTRRRPFMINWQGTPLLHRIFLLQLVLVPHPSHNPPKRVLIVAMDEAGVNAWALSVQNTGTTFRDHAQDVHVTIVTPSRFARMIRSRHEIDFDLAVMDRPTQSVWWGKRHLKDAWKAVQACGTKLFVMSDPWLDVPSALPFSLTCMEENVSFTTRQSSVLWRGTRVHGADWPLTLLSTVFRDVLFVWTPRTDWARSVQLDHIRQVTRQDVIIHLSVAQTWEYLLAGGAKREHLRLGSDATLPLPRTSRDRRDALSALCNATDRHARKNSKWTWLSRKLKDAKERRTLLPLVVFAERGDEAGAKLIVRALSTSPKLSSLRVRSAQSSKGLAADVAAFNEGRVDVLVLTTQAVHKELHLTLARTVVFWEPCPSAVEERRLLTACCPEPPAPLHIFTLVARFPQRQLRQCRQSPMPQTDAWLQKKACAQWPEAEGVIAQAPPHWPRSVLWDAVGGMTEQERRTQRVQQQILAWVPVVSHITDLGARNHAAVPRPDAWTVTTHATHREATRGTDGGTTRKRKAPVMSHHTNDAAVLKTLVTKWKRKTADTWHAWCPKGTTMAVWSRRITPIATKLLQEERRSGWGLDRLVGDASLLDEIAQALGVVTAATALSTSFASEEESGEDGSRTDSGLSGSSVSGSSVSSFESFSS